MIKTESIQVMLGYIEVFFTIFLTAIAFEAILIAIIHFILFIFHSTVIP